jgi:hypothetical protein
MTRPPGDLPERLLAADATAFERRVLEAAMRKQPSRASSARMARALGITTAAAATVAVTTTVAAGTAATKAAGVGTAAAWPWISAGVVGLVIGGAVVGTRAWQAPAEPRPVAAPTTTYRPPAPIVPELPATSATDGDPAPAPSRRARTTTATSDLRDQIEFIDAARASVSVGAHRRALEMLRRYQDKYPIGSFRPEAMALRIEVLIKLGRDAEARALAERFVTEFRGTLLAARVAELAGVSTK